MTRLSVANLFRVVIIAGLVSACGLSSQVLTSSPAASTPSITNTPSNIPAAATLQPVDTLPAPTEVLPVPTITFADHHNNGWSRIPTIMIVGKLSDARFAAVEKAIQWWNGQLQSIGTPFHFGAVTENYSFDPNQLVPEKLRVASDPSEADNPVEGNIPKTAASLGADIIIALTSYDLTSQNMIEVKDNNIYRDVILMRDFAKAGTPQINSSPGAPEHELGHAVGLMHDSSTHSIMCGQPWNDQKGCLYRSGQVILDQDREYILTIYPPSWKPAN